MKKLKRILAILLVFTMLFSMPIFTFAAEGESDEVETKVATLEALSTGLQTGFLTYEFYSNRIDAGQKGGYGNSHYVLNGTKSYNLMKIDFSNIDSVDYTKKDIQKVELLFYSHKESHTWDSTNNIGKDQKVNIAPATSDWSVGDTSLPTYNSDENKLISVTNKFSITDDENVTKTSKGFDSLVNKGYDVAATNYDNAVDITTLVTTNMNNGEAVTKLVLYGSNYYYINNYMIYITYKDNTKPEVIINRAADENSVTFSGSITDADNNEITSVTYSVDGGVATDITLTEGAYSITLDTSDMTQGEHTFTVTATDSLGAVTTLNSKFNVVGTSYATLEASNDGTQEGFLTYENINGYTSRTNGITAGKESGYGSYHYEIINTRSVSLLKLDLTNINSIDLTKKDVEKVELLFNSNKDSHTWDSDNNKGVDQTVKIAKVTSDWVVGEGEELPEYDADTNEDDDTFTFELSDGETTQETAEGFVSLVNKGYGSVAQNYDHAIDITDLFKNSVNSNVDELKLMVYGSNYYYVNNYMLYITYKDNNKPEVTVNVNKEGTSVTLSGTILDADGDKITSAVYSVDDSEATNAITLSDGAFSFSVDTTGMKQGKHTVNITASDEYGAVTVKIVEFTKKYDLTVSEGVYTIGEGSYTVSATLTNSTSESIDGYVIYALYNAQNVLLAADTESLNAESTTLSKEIIYSGSDSVSYAKIFVWDSLTDIMPLASATTAYKIQ